MNEEEIIINKDVLQRVLAESLAQKLDVSYMEALPYVTDDAIEGIESQLSELLDIRLDITVRELEHKYLKDEKNETQR